MVVTGQLYFSFVLQSVVQGWVGACKSYFLPQTVSQLRKMRTITAMTVNRRQGRTEDPHAKVSDYFQAVEMALNMNVKQTQTEQSSKVSRQPAVLATGGVVPLEEESFGQISEASSKGKCRERDQRKSYRAVV
jgi:hypothetical protein